MTYKENSRESSVLEPDFIDSEFEEIAGFKENVADEAVIDSNETKDRRAERHEEPHLSLSSEEIGNVSGESIKPLIIDDEYSETKESIPPVSTLHEKSKFDISSIAAEVDLLTRIDYSKKSESIPPESHVLETIEDMSDDAVNVEPEKSPTLEKKDRDELVIYEDDDIDIDYYSLDELEVTEKRPEISKAEKAKISPAAKESLRVERETPHDFMADTREENHTIAEGRDQNESTITIEITDTIKNQLSKNFEVPELGAIDLREAEKIANEDVLLLNEDDLIEELEDFDLVPLEGLNEKKQSGSKMTGAEPYRAAEKKGAPKEASVSENVAPSSGEEAPDIAIKFVPEDSVNVTKKDTGRAGAMPVKKDETSFVEAQRKIGGAASAKSASTRENIMPGSEEISFVEETILDSAADVPKKIPDSRATDRRDSQTSIEKPSELTAEARGKTGMNAQENAHNVNMSVSREEPRDRRRIEKSPLRSAQRERIPDELLLIETNAGGALIIDDDLVDKKESAVEPIFEVNELEKITSEIVEVIEGEAKLLPEADSAEDMGSVAGIMRGATPAFEDLLIDLEGEYSFRDEEIDVIDNAFVGDDYNRYIKSIDEYETVRGKSQVTTAVEIIGLDMREISDIEKNLFSREYEKINLDEALRFSQAGYDQPRHDIEMLKNCSYLVPPNSNLTLEEKKSIEANISSRSAVVFEEDIESIRSKLDDLRGKHGIVSKESVPDISDSVIIIDDENDIDRFIDSMPAEKQIKLKKLLQYLDGLFEKLPEDVIKNFANSEYFELYSKVLNDLGV